MWGDSASTHADGATWYADCRDCSWDSGPCTGPRAWWQARRHGHLHTEDSPTHDAELVKQ